MFAHKPREIFTNHIAYQEEFCVINKLNNNKRSLLPTLIVAISSTDPPSLIINMCLIEIAVLFNISISLAGQIQTIKSILGIVSALAMGGLSVKYDYKSLLTVGLLINMMSSISCVFAPSFILLTISYSAFGIVSALVTPMVFTYIGEYFPQERRTKTVGTLTASRTLNCIIIVQIIGLIVSKGTLRHAFLLLMVPLASISLILNLKVLPNTKSRLPNAGEISYFKGYRSVLRFRSAVACLLGNALSAAAWMGTVIYTASFLREKFLLTASQAALVLSGMSLGVLISNYMGGWISTRYGRKNLVVLSTLILGVLIIGYMNMPNLLSTLAIALIMSLCEGVILTVAISLALDQVPRFRGTMMSFNTASAQLGTALGAGIGGLVLFLFDWRFVCLSLGVIQLLATCIYQLAVKDPSVLLASTQEEKIVE